MRGGNSPDLLTGPTVLEAVSLLHFRAVQHTVGTQTGNPAKTTLGLGIWGLAAMTAMVVTPQVLATVDKYS